MYTFENNTVIPIKCNHIVITNEVIDFRIIQIEGLVARCFNVTAQDLKVFYNDSPAKVLCCFLLHDCLGYSIGSIAARYKIDRLFLRKNINDQYIKCLTDANEMAFVDGFKKEINTHR